MSSTQHEVRRDYTGGLGTSYLSIVYFVIFVILFVFAHVQLENIMKVNQLPFLCIIHLSSYLSLFYSTCFLAWGRVMSRVGFESRLLKEFQVLALFSIKRPGV